MPGAGMLPAYGRKTALQRDPEVDAGITRFGDFGSREQNRVTAKASRLVLDLQPTASAGHISSVIRGRVDGDPR